MCYNLGTKLRKGQRFEGVNYDKTKIYEKKLIPAFHKVNDFWEAREGKFNDDEIAVYNKLLENFKQLEEKYTMMI